MKKITIESTSKNQMLLSILKKVEEALNSYDLINKFDPNFAITISNQNDKSRIIILRVSRSAFYDNENLYRYYLHLCVGINPTTAEGRISTYNIIDFYDDYVAREIYALTEKALPYTEGDKIRITIVYNETGIRTTWFKYTEDDEELNSVEKFVDTVVMELVKIISDQCPAISIFFEYELRDGVKSKMKDNDPIILNIQKSEVVSKSYIISGSIPSTRYNTGRDLASYSCCYKDLRSLLVQYLTPIFSLRKVLLFDEHMEVTYMVRSIDQYKIIL